MGKASRERNFRRKQAKAAGFDNLAIARLLEKVGITQDQIEEVSNEVLIENFNAESEADDKVRGLEVVEGRPAQKGDFAIFSLKLFKDGVELKDQEVPRGKVELGAYEKFPEFDDNLVGMTIGEVKKVELNLMDSTDHGEFHLLGLRQKCIMPSEEGESKDGNTGSSE